MRIAQVNKAQNVFIDEVEVEKSMHVAQSRMVAHRVALVVIHNSAENVPRRGNRQKQQQPGHRLQRAPLSPLAGKQQVRNRRAHKEHRRNQPLGQQGQRHHGPRPVKAIRPLVLKPRYQAIKRSQKEKG